MDPDPDPGGPQTCGSGSGFGSGSATLFCTICTVFYLQLREWMKAAYAVTRYEISALPKKIAVLWIRIRSDPKL
jgi:hypothetical protein